MRLRESAGHRWVVAVAMAVGLLGSSAIGLSLGRPDAFAPGPRSAVPASAVAPPRSADVSRPASGFAVNWVNLTANESVRPPPRVSSTMVWDSTDGYLLLFGGELTSTLPFTYYNDSWSFLHGVWTNRTNSVAPSPRHGFMLADDPSDHGVLLFGGFDQHGPSTANDTWFYAGGTWTNLTAPGAPPGRFWSSMSYDSATATVILFGGNQGFYPLEYTNDTWSYHGGVWTLLHPTTAPPARDDQIQVDDPSLGGVVMFGGENASPYSLNDTWSYRAGTWSLVPTPTLPDGRGGPGMAYDVAGSVAVMYGGYPASTDFFGTWILNGTNWSSYSTALAPPAGTIWGQMAYDATDQEVVMLQGDGGYNATFALDLVPTGGGPGPLVVAPTVAPRSGVAPLPVNFTTTIAGGVPPYTVAWQFGESGAGSSVQNTSHRYDTAGRFDANLTVTDAAADHQRFNWTINVTAPGGGGPPLALQISASPTTVGVNESVAYVAVPSGGVPPYLYHWSFGDGVVSAAPDPTHAFSASGNYTSAVLVFDSAGGSVSRSITIHVTRSGPAGPGSGTTSAGPSVLSYVVFPGLLLLLLLLIAIGYYVLQRRRRRAAAGGPPRGAAPVPPPPPPPA